MTTDRQQLIQKLREDHDYLHDLTTQITSLCIRLGQSESCTGCAPRQREACNSDIENLIRTFIEATLHHNMLESAFMQEHAPREHRIAHNQAHLVIAERLKATRLDFRRSNNGISAIHEISEIMAMMSAHIAEYDQTLEQHLLVA